MLFALLISFTICFSIELLLTATLIYYDARDYLWHSRGRDEFANHSYHCETIIGILFSISLIALCIAGIVAIVAALLPRSELYSWFDVVITFNNQLLVGTNVRSSTFCRSILLICA